MASLLEREFEKASKRPWFRVRQLWAKLQVTLICLGGWLRSRDG